MNLILETTTGLLVPPGIAPRLPRAPVAATLQLVTNSVAALLAEGVPVALHIHAPTDLVTPLASFALWTRNTAFSLYQAQLNPLLEAGLGWLASGTLVGRISYGTPNVNGQWFQVQFGDGAGGGPIAPVQVVVNNYTGAATTAVQPIGLFSGRIATGQTEGYHRAKAAGSVTGLQLAAQVAPTGADLIVELYKNGVATGKTATLAAAAKTQETIFGSPLALAIGDVLQFRATQVGSAIAGSNLSVNAIIAPA
jgi:hypothetical protein